MFNQDEVNVIKKYLELASLNPEVKTVLDRITYVFIKIMFEHPLIDGNKRCAMKYLLTNIRKCQISDEFIEKICNFLAKEIA